MILLQGVHPHPPGPNIAEFLFYIIVIIAVYDLSKTVYNWVRSD